MRTPFFNNLDVVAGLSVALAYTHRWAWCQSQFFHARTYIASPKNWDSHISSRYFSFVDRVLFVVVTAGKLYLVPLLQKSTIALTATQTSPGCVRGAFTGRLWRVEIQVYRYVPYLYYYSIPQMWCARRVLNTMVLGTRHPSLRPPRAESKILAVVRSAYRVRRQLSNERYCCVREKKGSDPHEQL